MSRTPPRHHYTECGLPHVWIHGLCMEDDAGEEVIILPHVRDLHWLIANELVSLKRSLAGRELRFLRTEMGLTQVELGRLLHRRRITITRWEAGSVAIPPIEDAYVRWLAMAKLDLEKHGPEAISTWCKQSAREESVNIPVNIEFRDGKYAYRKAA